MSLTIKNLKTNNITLSELTTAQRNALPNPEPGMVVFNGDTSTINFWDGTKWAASGSGGLSSDNILTTTTAVIGTHYLVDTSGGAFTVTLPAGEAGARLKFSDASETWNAEPLTIAPASGETIDGYSPDETLLCDVYRGWVELTWDDTNSKWIIDTFATTNVGDATASAKGIIQLNSDFIATTARPGLRPETRLAVVNGTTAQAGIASNTQTVVIFNNEEVDIGNCFASNTFTVDIAGWYRISSGMRIGSTTENSLRDVSSFVLKNGARAKALGGLRHTTTAYFSNLIVAGSTVVYGAIGDTFQIEALALTTGSSTWFITNEGVWRHASFELIHKD
jgi:hypothetical protein